MTIQFHSWKSKFKACFETLINFGKGIERLKIYFDVLVILVMVLAILVSRDANKIAREALHKSETPWLKITSIGIGDDNTPLIKYVLVNFSDSPATELQIDLKLNGPQIVDLTKEDLTYTEDVMMPHDSGNFSFRYNVANWPEIAKLINAGKISMLFQMKYTSTQGRIIIVQQEARWVDDMFRDTKYHVSSGF